MPRNVYSAMNPNGTAEMTPWDEIEQYNARARDSRQADENQFLQESMRGRVDPNALTYMAWSKTQDRADSLADRATMADLAKQKLKWLADQRENEYKHEGDITARDRGFSIADRDWAVKQRDSDPFRLAQINDLNVGATLKKANADQILAQMQREKANQERIDKLRANPEAIGPGLIDPTGKQAEMDALLSGEDPALARRRGQEAIQREAAGKTGEAMSDLDQILGDLVNLDKSEERGWYNPMRYLEAEQDPTIRSKGAGVFTEAQTAARNLRENILKAHPGYTEEQAAQEMRTALARMLRKRGVMKGDVSLQFINDLVRSMGG